MPKNIPEKYSERSDPLNAKYAPEAMLNAPMTETSVLTDLVIVAWNWMRGSAVGRVPSPLQEYYVHKT